MHLKNSLNGWWRRAGLAVTMVCTSAAAVHGGGDPFSFPPSSRFQIQLPSGTFPSHLVVVDLNGDGKMDIATSGRNNEGLVYVVPGQGGGLFDAPVPIEIGAQCDSVVAADFNNNGHLDLAYAIRSHRGRVAVIFNAGDGSFPGEPEYYRVGRLTEGLAARDVDGDGLIDLVAANTNSGTIRVLRNQPDNPGSFALQHPVYVGRYAAGTIGTSHISPLDFAGGGLPGFAVMPSGTARASVVLNDGVALRTGADYRLPAHEGQTGGALNLTSGDMNGDGAIDLVVPMALLNQGQYVAIFPADAGDPGTFLSPSYFLTLGTSVAWTVAVADLDGDGRPDIAAGFALNGHLSLLRNVSSGGELNFSPPQSFFNVGGFTRTIVPADVNVNGVTDLVFTDYPAHRIHVWLNQTPQGGGPPMPPDRDGRAAPPAPAGAAFDARAADAGDEAERTPPPPLSEDELRARLLIPIGTPLTADLVLGRLAAKGDPPRDDLNSPGPNGPQRNDHTCGPGFGDCHEVNGSPGCTDVECCEAVCAVRPYCCTTDWDQECVELAAKLCKVPPPPCPGKLGCFDAHDEIGCNDVDCCEFICFLDGYCCSVGWDEICAELAAQLCGTEACALGIGGGIPEPEECPERINDGCLIPTPGFTDIACGQLYHGTAYAGAPRDSDWYRITVPAGGEPGPRRITWTVTSEFPSQLYIIRGTCELDIEVLATGFGGFCTAVSISACVEPGTYFLTLAPGTSVASLRRGAPCIDEEDEDPPPVIWGIEYVARATCADCPQPILGDLNGDGVVDVQDLLILLSSWGACPHAPAGCPADLNGSGSVDVQDLLILLANWG